MLSESAPDPSDATKRQSLLRDTFFANLPPRGRDWALMALAGLLAIAFKGINYAFNDQAVELTTVKHLLDPSLYPGDILFESMATKQPLFWQTIAALARHIPLEPLVIGLHLLVSALTIVAVWALAVNLFRDRRSANLGLLLVTLSLPMGYWLGLDPVWVVWQELVHRSFIFPWLLVALILALHRRLLPAMALVGLCANFHPMSAGVVGLMVIGGALVDRPARRRIPVAAVAAAVCALPMLAGIALNPGAAGASAAQNEQWYELLRLRMGHHIFPTAWEPTRWLGALLVLAIGFRAWLAVDREQLRHRVALAWFAVPLLLWIPGYLFTEVWPVPLIALAQLFRGTKFAMMLGLLYLGHHQVLRISTGVWTQIAVGWTALAVPVALWVASLPVAALAAIPHLLMPEPPPGRGKGGRWALLAGAAGLLLAIGGGAALNTYHRANSEWSNWWGGVGPHWKDVQIWVKHNSSTATTVMVPPEEKGFRFFSERPIVGDLKDGGPHQNDALNMIEWWQRMQDLGCEARGSDQIVCRDFRRIGADELLVIADRYGAELLVTYQDHDLPWEPIYSNERWSVYALYRVSDRPVVCGDLPLRTGETEGAAGAAGEASNVEFDSRGARGL